MSLFGIWANTIGTLDTIKVNVVHLTFLLVMGFLLYPAKPWTSCSRVSLFDWVLAALGVLVGLYLMFNLDALYLRGLILTPRDCAVGVLAILLVLEVARRVVGNVLPVLAIIAIVYARYGRYIPGIFGHSGFPWTRIILRLSMTQEGIPGSILNISATTIFLFILFGEVLALTGVAEFFNNCTLAMMGRRRGGPADVAVLASAAMGTINGSSIANAAAVGSFTVPLMKRVGYSPAFAGGLTAVAAIGGVIMPPIMGAAAFIMAGTLGVPYSRIMLAGLIPALLYYLSLFVTVDTKAQMQGIQGLPDDVLPKMSDVLKKAYLLIPLLVVVLVLVAGRTTNTAAFLGILACLVVGFINKGREIRIGRLAAILVDTARKLLPIGISCASVGIVVGVIGMTALGSTFTYNILKLSFGLLPLALVLVVLAAMVASAGLPAAPCYVIVAAVSAPALTRMGVSPLAAHMFVFWLGSLSGVTPPVALTAYTAAGVAGSDPNVTAFEGLKLALPGFIVPAMYVYRPELLGEQATALNLVLSIGWATAAVLATAWAAQGYFRKPMSVFSRIAAIGGSILLVPRGAINFVGIALIVVALAYTSLSTTSRKEPRRLSLDA